MFSSPHHPPSAALSVSGMDDRVKHRTDPAISKAKAFELREEGLRGSQTWVSKTWDLKKYGVKSRCVRKEGGQTLTHSGQMGAL